MGDVAAGANRVVLLVDDVRVFADGRQARVARTAEAAIAALQSLDRIDELWLDYDLARGLTIRPVLEHLERADPARVGDVVVHCSRPGAAHEMKTRLTAAGYQCRRVHPRGTRL